VPSAQCVPGALMIMHRGGVTEIAALSNYRPADLYAEIVARLAGSGRRDPTSSLAAECVRQEQLFGVDRVWTFFARQHLGYRPRRRRLTAVFAALTLTGILWTVIGACMHNNNIAMPLFGYAGLALVVGVLGLAYQQQRRRYPAHRVAHWQRAGLLISPGGMWL